MPKQIIVIGAGPAGLMAAGQAAINGANVLLLEKMNRAATKLAITGKGRCNITNALPLADFKKHTRTNFRFLKHALYSFNSQNLMEFFNNLGLETIEERGGRVFPASQKAGDVCDALLKWTKDSGVKIETGVSVAKIFLENEHFVCVSSAGNKQYLADAVIIATGGLSYPKTGSTGDGYKLAKKFGHKITPTRPALVPLETKGNIAQRLQGLSLKNAQASLWIDGKKTEQRFGEMLFTHFGLSGPIILSLSRYVVDALQKQTTPKISIDLKPALDDKQLDTRLLRDISQGKKQQMQNLLKELLPKTLIPVCLEIIDIPPDKIAGEITAEERKRLRLFLKNFTFEIKTNRPISEAIVTAGGIDTNDISPKTMDSKLIKGLYFAGEVLDVDADTGGFNLQLAFSTGRLAGLHASSEISS